MKINKNISESLLGWLCAALVLVLVVQSLDLIVDLVVISLLLGSIVR